MFNRSMFVFVLVIIVASASDGLCGNLSSEAILKELVVLKERVSMLEAKLIEKNEKIKNIKSESGQVVSEGGVYFWANRVNVTGGIELDFSYADDGDTGSNLVNNSTSNMNIGTVELGVEIGFHEFVTGNLVLKGEDLDDNDRVFWDEAIVSIQKEGIPFYFTGGKRGQPFGCFQNNLINDPITQELYEIAETGVTMGYAADSHDLDFSITFYKGEALMSRMLEGAYELDRTYIDSSGVPAAWRAGGMNMSYSETDDVSSFIANITAKPLNCMTMAVFYNSEPGGDQRNNTLGGMVNYEKGKLVMDIEYIGAVQREKNSMNAIENKESAWFAADAYKATEWLDIAFRYEGFNDDISGDQDGHPDNRYGMGFTWTLFEKDDFVTSLMAEYRRSLFEKAAGSTADDNSNELFVKLAFEY